MQQWERVSAAELIRGFGTWQARALLAPIIVTHRGRDALMLGPYVSESLNGSDQAVSLLDDIVESVLIVDRELRVGHANRAARDLIGGGLTAAPNVPLMSLLPGFEDEVIRRHLIRTLQTGEIFSGDVRSPLREDGWLRLKVVRTGEGLALIFRDVTDELNAFTLSDIKASIVNSIEALGTVGYARVSVRGVIERASASLCERIGTSEEAIRRVTFASLMPLRGRAEFSDRLEDVMKGGHPTRIESQLIARGGEEVDVDLSLSPINGLYATEGATVLANWHN